MFTWLGRIPLVSLAKSRAWARPTHDAERPIQIALAPEMPATWHTATIVSGRPMIQLVAEFDVRNASDQKLVLVSAKLRKPATEGLVRVHDRGVTSACALEPFASSRASVFFFVPLTVPPTGTTVVADVGVVDQFGGTHWAEKVRFKASTSDQPVLR